MKKLVFLTGAGMSVESGFKTFRGNDGLWENYPVEKVASHEGWLADPDLVTRFYNERRSQLFTSEPNEGHRLVAEMERTFDTTVITQNVDNLHERAGSSRVVHLHGELTKVCSSRDPYNPRYIRELTAENCQVAPGTKADDGSLLRPFIVFFGESVPMMETAVAYTQEADIYVVIGTSLVVYPAAGLLSYLRMDVPVFIIDPADVPYSSYLNITHIRKGASEGMRELKDILLKGV
ncbi:MAG: NAD-dependent deacylase [Prevotella sp.]|nr:NAD-dependent deacylase [Prevotella sp.]